MSIFSFGEYIEGKNYKVLDERRVRASSGIMFLLGMIAFINGFILNKYDIIPYVSGIIMISFFVAVFINPKFSPSIFIGSLFVWRQSPLPIGAVQKRFAWSLGLGLSATIFVLSIMLLTDASLFEPVCFLCIACLILLFLETAFGICVGCKLYWLSVHMKLLKKPSENPNCMGDACEVKAQK
jgi:hypothetical protein